MTKLATNRVLETACWVLGTALITLYCGTRAYTLVTCYPFYFVGSAPQRFIVRAVGVD